MCLFDIRLLLVDIVKVLGDVFRVCLNSFVEVWGGLLDEFWGGFWDMFGRIWAMLLGHVWKCVGSVLGCDSPDFRTALEWQIAPIYKHLEKLLL